jgi:hypothetical protein
MAILDDVKLNLRITNTAYNTEITDLINAAKADLKLAGLQDVAIDDTDVLIKRAIILYCKANFGYGNVDASRFQQSYEMLRNHLSQSLDYAYFAVTFTVTDSSDDSAIREAKVVLMQYTDTEATDEQIKYTDENGQAIFYVKAGNNYKYEVSADDYESDDDEDNLIDVSTDNVAVAISLAGV